MATSAQSKVKAHSTKGSRLREPLSLPKRKGKAQPKDGPQFVGGGAKRAKPNPILLGGLGLIALLGLARVAMPTLFGGGSTNAVGSFPAPIITRHLVPRGAAGTAPVSSSTATTAAPGRPIRDPFTAPPGFGS